NCAPPNEGLLFAEKIVPQPLVQIELAIVVMELRRHHNVIADKELIVYSQARRIRGLLQYECADNRHAGAMRQLVQRIKVWDEAVPQVQECPRGAFDDPAMRIWFVIFPAMRPHKWEEGRGCKPACIKGRV